MNTVKLVSSKNECCGCSACMNICPVNAIVMKEDENGFLFPFIDEQKCINCEACIRTCLYNNEIKKKSKSAYAATWKNEKIMNSSSGGISAAIAEYILNQEGIVYGSSMRKNLNSFSCEHIRIACLSDLYKIQGSKYVQSTIGNTYQQVKKDLSKNRLVLFFGTPCQIQGLKVYLKNVPDNLILIDIICHGVPNQRMFNEYLYCVIKRNKKNIETLRFRTKVNGWGKHNLHIFYEDNSTDILDVNASSYFSFFINGMIYRDSCYSCKFTTRDRVSDITLGDYWGIEDEEPEYLESVDIRKGISCVLINSEKGQKIFDSISTISKKESSREKIAQHNDQLNQSAKISNKRNKILNQYNRFGYKYIDNLFMLKQKIKRIVR